MLDSDIYNYINGHDSMGKWISMKRSDSRDLKEKNVPSRKMSICEEVCMDHDWWHAPNKDKQLQAIPWMPR